MIEKNRTYSGTKNDAVTEREQRNRRIARTAAAEGIVLLKNDGLLPLKKRERIALFGSGAAATVKGGTGSGDVNERETVSVYQGLADAGFLFSNKQWLDSYSEIYQEERKKWRDMLRKKLEGVQGIEILNVYSHNTFQMPAGEPMNEHMLTGAKAAFYVISRKAGEGADRFADAGDYYLSEQERRDLAYLSAHCENVAVIINAGGLIDLTEILSLPNLKVLLSIVQPGMEGGHALADILTGEATPSGKLTDSWVKSYSDVPNADTFSHMNGNVEKEFYEEGIYVGYRYFDSFDIDVQFPFGYGLSYTDFSIDEAAVTVDTDVSLGKDKNNQILVTANVKNIGEKYAGKEVVQIYATCPQSGLEKEYKRLCGFVKTGLLNPGEVQQVQVAFEAKALASFDHEKGAWVVEAGKYGIWVGNSSRNISLVTVLEVKEEVVLEQTEHICTIREALKEISYPKELRLEKERKWHKLAEEKCVPMLAFAPFVPVNRKEQQNLQDSRTEQRQFYETAEEKKAQHTDAALREEAEKLVEMLSEDELITLVIGEISKGQGQALGSAGIQVPGAAGETSRILEEKYGVPGVSMADGPAGLRLIREYQVNRESGEVYSEGILDALEGGFLASGVKHPDSDVYHQYCTAIPVGTLLAQTWDTELMETVGRAVAEEMEEFGISWWLAPGMNIHRNPLCGRNFEYYSEDPLVSGCMAAAITRGVQSIEGRGTTIKHFACNNQEDNRMGSDSVVSERALREIYLRGFEIAVKTAQPMAVMTSYNLINGVHAANSRDLCTQVLRNEWDFKGIVMTDWTTTEENGGSISWKCPWAGNDLIMPGSEEDKENIRQALAEGLLSVNELKDCAARLLAIILQSRRITK